MSDCGCVLLLMATTSYRADDFLDAARHLDVDVTVASDHRQTLAAFARDASIYVDFGDTAASVERIAALHRRHPLTAVVAAEDEGTILAAATAERLGLPHNPPAAVRAARYKDRMRVALTTAGLPTPRFRVFNAGASMANAAADVAADIGYPCVLKPTFLSASRGVIRADDDAGFAAAWRRVRAILAEPRLRRRDPAAARRVLVESYVPGTEVALEGLLDDGMLRTLALLDKPDPLEGPIFEETIYVTPSRLPAGMQADAERATAAACAALGLRNGPVHAELRHDGRVAWVIEIAPRSIGGLCSRILRYGLGMSLEELILRHALSLPVPAPHGDTERTASGVMMIPVPGRGRLVAVRGIQEAGRVDGVDGVVILARPGDEMVPLPEGHRYPGFIFASGTEPGRVEAALRAAYASLEFLLE